MEFMNWPELRSFDDYEASLTRVVDKLKKKPGVRAIYQVGGVSTPGISDIDLWVVFEDDKRCTYNPLADMDREDRYFFVHNLFGISESYLYLSSPYHFFHNIKNLWGEEYNQGDSTLEDIEQANIARQTALEYLIKMYITLVVGRSYKVIKVRSLLLLTKALLYDLATLNITFGGLSDQLHRIIVWRNNWFEARPSNTQLRTWHETFYHEVENTLSDYFKKQPFFVPSSANLLIYRNLEIISSDLFGYKHRGILLPPILAGLSKKFFNFQHRFNKFNFHIPLLREGIFKEINDRHICISKIIQYNKCHLPFFGAVPFGLSYF